MKHSNRDTDSIPRSHSVAPSARRTLGHADGHDHGVPPEGADAAHAGHVHPRHPCGPPGPAQRVRLPRLQDQEPRGHLRLDLQPQDQGEGLKVDAGRRGPTAANLERKRFKHLECQRQFTWLFCTKLRFNIPIRSSEF